MTQTINAQGMTQAQLAYAFAGNPACIAAFYPPLVAPVAAALGVTLGVLNGSLTSGLGSLSTGLSQLSTGLGQVNSALGQINTGLGTIPISGTITPAGGIQFALSNGGSLPIAGQIVPSLSFVPVTLPPGSSSTAAMTQVGQSYSVTLGLAQGPVGPQGPGQSYAYGVPSGAWAPSNTGSLVLASGGLLNGSLATPGLALTVGGVTGAQTILGTAIDGVTAVTGGDQWYATGSLWQYLPRQTSSNFSSITFGSASLTLDNNDGANGEKWLTASRDVYASVDPTNGFQSYYATYTALSVIGTQTVANLVVTGTYSGPSASVTSALGDVLLSTNTLQGQTEIANGFFSRATDGTLALCTGGLDKTIILDATTGTITCAALVTAGGTGSSAFTPTDIANAESAALAQNAADSAPLFGAQPLGATNYAFIPSIGPSENVGSEAIPVLPLPAWPGGVLSIGTDQRGQCSNINSKNIGTFVSYGDTAFHTAVPNVVTSQAPQSQGGTAGAIITTPSGATTITNATITVLSAGTISVTGTCSSAPSSIFANGDTSFIGGCTVATANNYNAPGVVKETNYFMVLATGSNSATLAANNLYAAGSESSIVLSEYAYPNNAGETPLLTAAYDLRAAQLSGAGLTVDTAHQIVIHNDGVGNQQISQWVPGASPNLFTSLLQAATQAKTNAGSLTISTPGVLILGGGPEYSAGTTKAAIKTAVLAFYNAYVAQIATTLFGQPLPPFGFLNVRCGQNTLDFSSAGYSDPMPWANAVLELCGMGTAAGVAASSPLLICIGNSGPAIAHSQHFDANGAVQYGAQVGKRMILAMLKNGTPLWRRPPWVSKAILRGSQVLCTVSGLRGMLTNRPIFDLCVLQTIANSGISVTDSTCTLTASGNGYSFSGALPISSVVITGPNTFEVNLTSSTVGSNPYLWVADQSVHAGLTSLCDIDPSTSNRSWYYAVGSGQSPWNNQPASSGTSLAQPVGNGDPINTYQMVQPCAIPIVAG